MAHPGPGYGLASSQDDLPPGDPDLVETEAATDELRAAFPNVYRSAQGNASTHRNFTTVRRLQNDLTTSGLVPYLTVGSSPSTTPRTTAGQLRSAYIPRQSYTAPGRRGTAGVRRLPPTPYTRRPPASASNLGRKFNRSIVVVGKHDENVPKGARRRELHDMGLVCGFVDFNTNWSEQQVVRKVEEATRNILDASKPYPRFEFLQAVAGRLVKPSVLQDHHWTGDKILRLAGQGDVYIRPTYSSPSTSVAESQVGTGFGGDTPSLPGTASTSTTQPGPSHTPTTPTDLPETNGLHSLPYTAHSSRCCVGPDSATTDSATPGPSCSPLDKLSELFPGKEADQLAEVLQSASGDIDMAVEQLLHQSENTEPPTNSQASYDYGDVPLRDLLIQHQHKVISKSEVFELEINREKLWRQALCFYKNSSHNSSRLAHQLHIEFSGEEGVDAGALRAEFFEALLNEMNSRLFEGDAYRRIPKNEWNTERMFELAGTVIAHSIIQGGPGFPCLCPPLYSYLLHNERDKALQQLPCKSDIPRNLATEGILNLIEEVDNAGTDEEIDKVLENPERMALINASGWPTTAPINTKTKSNLLQGLIFDEIISKRFPQIVSLRRGLENLGVLELCRRYPSQTKQLFVYQQAGLLTSEKFATFLRMPSNMNASQAQTFQWFLEYTKEREREPPDESLEGKVKANLQDLLKFVTGQRTIPPLGLIKPITVEFTEDQRRSLPQAAACFNILTLPLCHTAATRGQFFDAMDKAILFSYNHFGQE